MPIEREEKIYYGVLKGIIPGNAYINLQNLAKKIFYHQLRQEFVFYNRMWSA